MTMLRRLLVGLAAVVLALGAAASPASGTSSHAKHKTASQWICEEQVEPSPGSWGNYCYGPISGGATAMQSYLTTIEQQNAAHGQKDLVLLYTGLHQSLDSQYVMMLSSTTGCINDGTHNVVPTGSAPARMGNLEARVDAMSSHPPIHMHDNVLSARSTDAWANGAHCDVGFGPYGWDNVQTFLPNNCSWSPMATSPRYDLNGNIGPVDGEYEATVVC